MKNTTNFLLVVLVILGVGAYMKKNHISIKSPFKEKVDPMHNLIIRQKKVVFTIHGLGNYDESYLFQAQKIIKEKFGLDSKIGEPVSVPNSCYTSDGLLNLDKFKYNNYLEPHIYITNSTILSDNDDKAGLTFENELFVSIFGFKTTLLHELGHWEFLGHCEKKNCVMFHYVNYSGDFCDECTTKLNRFLPKQQ